MQNKWSVPKKYGSKNLHIVSKRIIDLAFSMGGSEGLYYEPVQCNFVFPNGRPCWDEKRGSYDSECPICKGSGHYYKDAIETPIIVMDSPNIPKKDNKLGLIYEDIMRIAIPNTITPRIVNITNNGIVILAPAKFAIKSFDGKTWNILYMQGEPKDVYLAGTLMHTFEVGTNVYIENPPAPADRPAFMGDSKKEDILKQINEDILSISSSSTTGFIVNSPPHGLDDF